MKERCSTCLCQHPLHSWEAPHNTSREWNKNETSLQSVKSLTSSTSSQLNIKNKYDQNYFQTRVQPISNTAPSNRLGTGYHPWDYLCNGSTNKYLSMFPPAPLKEHCEKNGLTIFSSGSSIVEADRAWKTMQQELGCSFSLLAPSMPRRKSPQPLHWEIFYGPTSCTYPCQDNEVASGKIPKDKITRVSFGKI